MNFPHKTAQTVQIAQTEALNPNLRNKSVSFRHLGSTQLDHGIATGREVGDSIEILYYQPTKVLVRRDRVNLPSTCGESALAMWPTVEKPKRMTNKAHPATGWISMGSRGKNLYYYQVGRSRKSITLESRQEEVLVYLLNQMRIGHQQVIEQIQAFRSKPELTLDRLVEQELFTTKHLEAILQAEIVDWEVETIVKRLGISF